MHRRTRNAVSISMVGGLVAAGLAAGSSGLGSSASASSLPTLRLSSSNVKYTEMGGATPLATDTTVAHWSSSFTDPTNGQTYAYTMVGTDPAQSTSTTTPTDIIPVQVTFAASNGLTLRGGDVADRTAASPLFSSGSYTSTAKYGDYAHVSYNGKLSAGNTGVQYEDAVMRSQFNKVGSGYHVRLGAPTIEAPVSLTVPQGKGFAFQSSLGTVGGLVDLAWFSSAVQNILGQQHADPTHLPIILTDNVMLYVGTPDQCCVLGYHGAAHPNGVGTGSTNGSGNQQVQTFAYASYTRPGTFDDGQGGPDPFVNDIHGLSHEISEWGDDPFTNNTVNPWLTPTAPQYGCTSLLETGDPVVGIGFTMPGNTYDKGSYADGYYHPEDEVFLPWFARQSPNTTAQPTQKASANIGRYTFMGDLNPYPGFRQPATGC